MSLSEFLITGSYLGRRKFTTRMIRWKPLRHITTVPGGGRSVTECKSAGIFINIFNNGRWSHGAVNVRIYATILNLCGINIFNARVY